MEKEMQVQIAVFGKNKEIVDTLERVVNNNEDWKAYCSYKQDELKQIIQTKSIQILLYSSGIGASEVAELENWMTHHFPDIKQIHHYGGGSGLLQCEINSVLEGLQPIVRPSVNMIK